MSYIAHKVQPIANSIRQLQLFFGQDQETDILVAKAIIKGATIYAAWNNDRVGQPIYPVDTVLGRRAEAVLVQQELQHIPRVNESARSTGKKILTLDEIAELHRHEHLDRSQILPAIITTMGADKTTYRGRLAALGRETSDRLRNSIRYCNPETIDVYGLKERQASLVLKTIFREFGKIQAAAGSK